MRRIAASALLGCALVVFAASGAQAEKSYSFPRVVIDATVLPDGTLDIVEHRTFDFHGPFTYAFFDIDSPFGRIEDFRILEHGRRLITVAPTEQNGKFHALWTFSAQDEQRTFTIAYRVRCAVRVYTDTAYLLWQFVGTGWTVPTDHVRIAVHIPGRAEGTARPSVSCPRGENDIGFDTTPLERGDVRAWGHGPFNGNVDIPDPQTVMLSVDDLHPRTFVEGSIVFPPRSVPKAFLIHRTNLPQIVAKERRLAGEANALRHRHQLERSVAGVLYAVLPMVFLLLVLLAFLRDRVPGIPGHLQEPPEDIHPVQLAYLWAAYRGRFSPKNAYRAQLLHLASTRAIEVSAVGRVSDPDDFTLRFLKEPDDELDKDFTDFLFAPDGGDGSTSVSLKSLEATGKRRTKLLEWSKDATKKTTAVVTKIRKGKSRLEANAVALLAVLSVAGAYLMGKDLAGGIAYGVIPVALVGWFLAIRFMPPRLSEELRERLAKWKSFRRFLKDFSSLPNAPALAVIIWENYMVEAVALGVANKVEKQVRALVATEELPAPWPGAPPGQGGYMWNRSLLTTHVASAAAVVAHSSSSWSSGWGSSSSGGGFSGGGFSGGGGGGGGGTGGGAG
ncbi:MAG: DUF2207 domain-containing protein [Actinomycetota bacterium]